LARAEKRAVGQNPESSGHLLSISNWFGRGAFRLAVGRGRPESRADALGADVSRSTDAGSSLAATKARGVSWPTDEVVCRA
jgi:hypothetical protein